MSSRAQAEVRSRRLWRRSPHGSPWALVAMAWLACGCGGKHSHDSLAAHDVAPDLLSGYAAAAAYSRAHRGRNMVVLRAGEVEFEDYSAGEGPDDAHFVASGTKSFSCALAVAAAQEGLLTLDEPVSDTIVEWKDDPGRRAITIRHLLSLTSGLDVGKNGQPTPYGVAILSASLHDPGTTFAYGPVPFQVFGALVKRKLEPLGLDPLEFLDDRVLEPIGLEYEQWKYVGDGEPRLPGGARLTARSWARYGQLIARQGRWEQEQVLDPDLLARCFEGSKPNPSYGLGFWLPMNEGGLTWKGYGYEPRREALVAAGAPDDLVFAAGLGGQRLYIVPSLDLVVARQARKIGLGGGGFEDSKFLAPIFSAIGAASPPSQGL